MIHTFLRYLFLPQVSARVVVCCVCTGIVKNNGVFMPDPQSAVYKLCIEPMQLQTAVEAAANLDIVHHAYNKCKNSEETEERKTDNGKAFRHKKIEPTDLLVRLAAFNLKSKLAKSYSQEMMSLQLGDGSGDTLQCKVTLAGDATTKLTKDGESGLVQAAIVAPATRWLCGRSMYSWFQTGDVMQTSDTPGVGDMWLCVGWVWLSSHRSFFHYKWANKGKLPTQHIVMIRLISVVSYIEQFEQGIIADRIDLDAFDTATLHFDDVDSCLWVNWWDAFFPRFPHSRYTPLLSNTLLINYYYNLLGCASSLTVATTGCARRKA